MFKSSFNWPYIDVFRHSAGFFACESLSVDCLSVLVNNLKFSGKESTPEGAFARVQDNYRYILY